MMAKLVRGWIPPMSLIDSDEHTPWPEYVVDESDVAVMITARMTRHGVVQVVHVSGPAIPGVVKDIGQTWILVAVLGSTWEAYCPLLPGVIMECIRTYRRNTEVPVGEPHTFHTVSSRHVSTSQQLLWLTPAEGEA